MKIYTFLAQDQEMMYKNYFLSSLPENFEPHPTIHKEFYVDYGFNSAFELRMHQKVSFMLEVCRKNFGNIILFSDADLQFFGPFKKTLIQELGNLDMVCMEDDAWSASRKLCAGLMICRCNKNMLKLFSHMKQYFHTDDQISLNNHKNTCKHKTFPTEKFFTVGQVLGRQWQGETNFSIPKKILVHHANWTIGLKNKIKLLEIVKNRVHNRQRNKK